MEYLCVWLLSDIYMSDIDSIPKQHIGDKIPKQHIGDKIPKQHIGDKIPKQHFLIKP